MAAGVPSRTRRTGSRLPSNTCRGPQARRRQEARQEFPRVEYVGVHDDHVVIELLAGVPQGEDVAAHIPVILHNAHAQPGRATSRFGRHLLEEVLPDMNRFMRLLAIVSVLALIPAVAGGLLGMNLADSPWSVTLGEVAFVTLVLMIGVLYAFMAKGWLR